MTTKPSTPIITNEVEGRKQMARMGRNNAAAVAARGAEGAFLRASTSKKSGKEILTPNTTEQIVLMLMAIEAYDWPLTAHMKKHHVPARLYERGVESIAADIGYGSKLTEDEMEGLELGESLTLMREKLERGRQVVSKHIASLKKKGLVLEVRPPRWSSSKNTNAAYLLLIGDDEENREVLAWWKECEAAGWNRR